MRHKWDGRVIKGCTDMKQEMLGIRRVRDEESRLELRIIMIRPIEGARERRSEAGEYAYSPRENPREQV